MADAYIGIPVSDLTEATQVTEEDLLLLEQASTPKKLTGKTLIAYLAKMLDGHGGIKTIAKTGTSGLVDTYTITLADGAKSSFAVTNGAKGDPGDAGHVWIKYASQKPTEESYSMSEIPDAWIGICPSNAETAPTSWREYTWFRWKGDPGPVGQTPRLSIGAVTSVGYDEPAEASISGTPENPVLSLWIPKGRDGADGEYSSDWAENSSENTGYVRNRTHYVASVENYKFSAEVSMGSGINAPFASSEGVSLNYGVMHRVLFDDVEYFCRSQDIVGVLGTNVPALGNLSLLSKSSYEDTGEPFALYIMGGTGYLTAPDYSGRSVVLTVCEAEVVEKLDNKYLDAVWTATKTDRGIDGIILSEQDLSFTNSMLLLSKFPNRGLVDGGTYTVTWKGTDYECVCFTQDGAQHLGNGALNSVYGGEEVPFCFVSYGGSSVFVYKDTDTAETVTAKIVGHREVILEKLPAEFMPDVLPYVVLQSPNGSKFKVTVSDAGVLSAVSAS